MNKIFKLSALAVSMALAIAAAPAYAGHVGPTADAGPIFLTNSTCVLNPLGAGDCVISGTVGVTQLTSSPSLSPEAFPSTVSGTFPTIAGEPVTYVADANLTGVTITGTNKLSVLSFGCNNTATAPGQTDPCFMVVAVRPGGVVGGVLQGELSYTYNALSSALGSTYVQTGVANPIVETVFEGTATASPPPAGAGQFLVDDGLVAGGAYEWTYFQTSTASVGYNEATDPVFGSVTVDPPVQDYLSPSVGGTYSDPTIILGSDGQRVGNAGVLGSNSPESFGLSEPGPAVPEPTTLGLLGLGALAAVFGRKRLGVVGL